MAMLAHQKTTQEREKGGGRLREKERERIAVQPPTFFSSIIISNAKSHFHAIFLLLLKRQCVCDECIDRTFLQRPIILYIECSCF